MTRAAEAAAYQKDWLKGLRQQITSGASFAFVNADTPHEIFHFMDMPMVTNQWWSAVIAAKQQAPYFFDWMEDEGFHGHLPKYSSLPLVAQLEGDPSRQPWGGLPAPALLCARQSSDEHGRIFRRWSELTGAPLHLLSAPGVADPAPNWWEMARENWEELYGTDRLDLLQAEIEELITAVEDLTGRSFDREGFAVYMDKIDRMEKMLGEVSDLIASAPKVPMGIAEQMPNVMIPQWHRGSDWALSHVKGFRDEVAERIEAGHAECPNEKIRMMWIGAGLWFDTSFYRAFEETHGATFAWSMYLPFASDGYIRADHGDPVRALAARVSAMNEQLHQPPWVNEWLVAQARKYRIDVALMLIPEHDRFSGYGSLFAKRALEQAGVKVIEIWSDMVDPRAWDREAAVAQVTAALDEMEVTA
ncbi:2-hydroxyglutaryl-CoA dehydratase, D-component [Pseudooceanicola antarcticus]|uniref:2-hydroxyacyl-CoA dehydratase n=1 Tax=Pseudooceanicola antarcticus TaxID=1247613 RepID=A0A285IS94_9RHOB|nr:2-hydroxyacyl-CoA dehydratase family protein [Pseudooceanicola antarcticus]PJE31446.1 2-hydroxyacyl-CoA dehydratase [Pseudooceanicola antarcticus]SNY49956.1 2-hydroxyglutaryl-CoA dehydratase, D-component [Pseudooceanicola antarcticus]